MKKFGLIAAAIVLFTAGMLYAVHRLTDPGRAARAGAPADEGNAPPMPAASTESPYPPPDRPAPQSFADADPAEPIVIPAPPMPPTGPIRNEPARIQGPPPAPLPADPVERQQALEDVRKRRVFDQMDQLNRRSRERAAKAPPPAPAPPPAQGP